MCTIAWPGATLLESRHGRDCGRYSILQINLCTHALQASLPWRNVVRLLYMGYWFFKNSISNTKFAMPGLGQGFRPARPCLHARASCPLILGYGRQASQHEADRAMAGGYSNFVFDSCLPRLGDMVLNPVNVING